MARVSSASEDAFHFKGTFADGWGDVIGAQALVYQFPPDKESGEQRPADLYVELTIQRLQDGEGNKAASPPEQVLLSVQRASKETGQLDAVHPGNYPDGNLNADPADCGASLGAAGNTLFAVQDGFQLNDKTKWMLFAKSLEEKGFKPAVLKPSYFPALVGLRAYFKTETRKKWSDKQENDPTVFVADKITRYPYEQGAQAAAAPAATAKGKKTAPAASAPASAAPAPAAPPAAATAAPAANGGASAKDLATAIILDTLAPAKKGTPPLPNIAKLKVEAFMAINKHKPAVPVEMKAAIQQQMQDEDWLIEVGVLNNKYTINDDGSITFA